MLADMALNSSSNLPPQAFRDQSHLLATPRYPPFNETTMSTPITREHFISPDHVLTALRGPNWPHAPAMMSIVTDDGQLTDVPVPAEWVQRGTLPEGFAVDFLFDPEELVLKVKNSGKNYIE